MANSNGVERLPYTRKHFPTIDAYMRQWLVDMGFVGRGGLGLITGRPGAGKSLFGYTILWWVKKLFGIQCTVDAKPNPDTFGKFDFFEHTKILDEIEKADKMARESTEWLNTDDLIFYKRMVLLDEFYKLAHNRNCMNILTRQFEYVIKQWRHYESFFLCSMPFKNEVDTKGIDQYITIDVQAAWSLYKPETALYVVYNRDTLVESPFTIYGPNYYALYNTKNPITAQKFVDPKRYKDWIKRVNSDVDNGPKIAVGTK